MNSRTDKKNKFKKLFSKDNIGVFALIVSIISLALNFVNCYVSADYAHKNDIREDNRFNREEKENNISHQMKLNINEKNNIELSDTDIKECTLIPCTTLYTTIDGRIYGVEIINYYSDDRYEILSNGEFRLNVSEKNDEDLNELYEYVEKEVKGLCPDANIVFSLKDWFILEYRNLYTKELEQLFFERTNDRFDNIEDPREKSDTYKGSPGYLTLEDQELCKKFVQQIKEDLYKKSR